MKQENKLKERLTGNTLLGFLEWKEKQSRHRIGGKEWLYDIKGHYKYLKESDLLDYYLVRVLTFDDEG